MFCPASLSEPGLKPSQSSTFRNTKSTTRSLYLGSVDLLRSELLRKSMLWENWEIKVLLWPSWSLFNCVVVSRQMLSKGYGPPLSTTATPVSETGRGSRGDAVLTSWQQRLGACVCACVWVGGSGQYHKPWAAIRWLHFPVVFEICKFPMNWQILHSSMMIHCVIQDKYQHYQIKYQLCWDMWLLNEKGEINLMSRTELGSGCGYLSLAYKNILTGIIFFTGRENSGTFTLKNSSYVGMRALWSVMILLLLARMQTFIYLTAWKSDIFTLETKNRH